MKKLIFLTVLAGVMPLAMMAQDDDLYFTPKKTVETGSSSNDKVYNKPTYYVGSNRDIDEYNRRGKFSSYYQKIGTDTLGNDVITFHKGNGLYPDSTYVDTAYVYPGSMRFNNDTDDDYAYSRRMSRFDGYYGWYDPWFYGSYGYYGYSPYWYSRWGWYDPWDPWYCGYGYGGWYDPWYYGYGYGYGYPYYGGYYGWGYPYYGGWGGGYASRGGITGTRNHSYGGGFYSDSRSNGFAQGRFGGSRSSSSFGGNSRSVSVNRGTYNSRSMNSDGVRFGGSRSYDNSNTRSYTPSYNSGSSSFGGSSHSGGGFSGGHSGGGGFSGGGGGGHFGGHR